MWAVLGAPTAVEVPVLHGFNFQGGGTVSPEFFALLLGLVLYTATYIAEIVRSGIQAVALGQWEAAGALGLRRGAVLRRIVLPQALRVIMPPMTSQYPQSDQEHLAGGGHRLPGRGVDRQHDAEPDRPGDRGHRVHHGGLPHHQPVDQPVHELVQRAYRAGGALSR